MAAALTEKGYSATTVADVVRHAHVSKRTFYECFNDKEECLLESYAEISGILLETIEGASKVGASRAERVEHAVRAYLLGLASMPALTRTYILEIQSAGPRALDARRAVMSRFAQTIMRIINAGEAGSPSTPRLSEPVALALVGGINELLLREIESQRIEHLIEIKAPILELLERWVG